MPLFTIYMRKRLRFSLPGDVGNSSDKKVLMGTLINTGTSQGALSAGSFVITPTACLLELILSKAYNKKAIENRIPSIPNRFYYLASNLLPGSRSHHISMWSYFSITHIPSVIIPNAPVHTHLISIWHKIHCYTCRRCR